MTVSRSKDNKRQFATEQFNKLVEVGFSRKVAGVILRTARPRLAVVCGTTYKKLHTQAMEIAKAIRKEDNDPFMVGLGPEDDKEMAPDIMESAVNLALRTDQEIEDPDDNDQITSIRLRTQADNLLALPEFSEKDRDLILNGILAAINVRG